MLITSSIDMCIPSIAASFDARIDSGEHSIISAAQRSAVSIKLDCGTTSFTKPQFRAVSASMGFPVNIIPIALFIPS